MIHIEPDNDVDKHDDLCAQAVVEGAAEDLRNAANDVRGVRDEVFKALEGKAALPTLARLADELVLQAGVLDTLAADALAHTRCPSCFTYQGEDDRCIRPAGHAGEHTHFMVWSDDDEEGVVSNAPPAPASPLPEESTEPPSWAREAWLPAVLRAVASFYADNTVDLQAKLAEIDDDLFDHLGTQLHQAADELAEPPAGPLFDVRACRSCGCTDERACEGGCVWVADDLCSSCVRDELAHLQDVSAWLGGGLERQAAVIAAATTLRTSGVAGELGELLSDLYELVDVRVELQIPDPFDVGELVETWRQKQASTPGPDDDDDEDDDFADLECADCGRTSGHALDCEFFEEVR